MAVRRSQARTSARRRPTAEAGGDTPRRSAERGSAELRRLRRQLAAQSRELSDAAATIARLEQRLQQTTARARTGGDPAADTDQASAYRDMVSRVHALVAQAVPHKATVIVVGKADKELMALPAARVWSFPQAADGSYAGFYPACSTSAIVHLEAVRAKGADYLIVPESSRWWLDHYVGFSRYLDQRFVIVADEPGAGVIVAFRQTEVRPATETRGFQASVGMWHAVEQALSAFRARADREPAILDWNTSLNLAARFPEQAVFSPPSEQSPLPYLDDSIDIVAVRGADAAAAEEARRVAGAAVITFAANGGGPSCSVAWKAEPAAHQPPTTSIVIPCFNGSAQTSACLTALRETLPPDFDGEIIVVDDASSDDTRAVLRRWARREPRLKVIRNRTNAGFIRTTNAGAEAATGELLVFLNNDTIPLAGWLPPMQRMLADHPEVGAVGGRLIHPDGRLQEAGSLVFRDGSAANFGRGDLNPDLPLYTFVRDVDYCSAALMATRRSLFEAAGGFDLQYEPGYYEDTDYCFKVRDRGYRVVIQPESVVVHVEGGTAGLDLSIGMKRYQVVNQEKFRERWGRVLAHHPERPLRFDFATFHGLSIRNTANGAAAR